MSQRIIRISGALLVAVSACSTDGIEWQEPHSIPGELSGTTELGLDPQNRLVRRPSPGVQPPAFPGQCAGSVRVAGDTTGGWYAVWWSARSDSTADVVVSRSADGTTWRPAVRVDSVDAGRVGCQRPAPSIATDGDNVYVAYAMTAREGPGIFASHSMDRGTMFHAPVAVVYGERLGLTAIAARGDLVAVAYEDPNSRTPRIGVAFSRTMGHPFESRQVVSPSSSPAWAPGIALGEGKIVVTWKPGQTSDAPGPRAMRAGDIR